jgi:hypothetical protein
MNILQLVHIALVAFRRKVRNVFRRRDRNFLRMPVSRAPDPQTLDSLGRERLQTHVRTRPDLT